MNFNLHTHTNFCDGKAKPEAYVEKAVSLGFHTLGFSGHAPVPFENKFSIKKEELSAYFTEVDRLKAAFRTKITVLKSLEIDFIPQITKDFSYFREAGNLDYAIGGVHLIRNKSRQDTKLWFIDGPYHETYDAGLEEVFEGNPRKGVEAYYSQLLEMIATQQPDIIAHLDKIKMHNKERFFSEDEGWYKTLVWKTLKVIAENTNAIVEVNTRGLYKKRCTTFFPGPQILEQIAHLGIPVTLSSDAHQPDELDGFYEEAVSLLKDIGFKTLSLYDDRGRITQKI